MTIHNSSSIHPNCIIDEKAIIGKNCKIGPFCYISSDVILEDNTELFSHVSIVGKTLIGKNTKIWPFSSIGHHPQDLKYKGEPNELIIGSNNKIRESVSINPGTKGGGGITKIGDDCLLMLGSHVGHDCIIGNSVVIANNSAIAGHVIIGDNVTIGGLSGIHQFCRIGEGAMVGALSMVTNDIIPFTTVVGDRPRLSGLNLIGLKRRGVSLKIINDLKRIYKKLFQPSKNLRGQAENILSSGISNEYEDKIVSFVLEDSSRSFLTPKT